jgi:hypothetical protein
MNHLGKHVPTDEERSIWRIFEEKLSYPDRPSGRELVNLLLDLQTLSSYWTRKTIQEWIFNHNLYANLHYRPTILHYIPDPGDEPFRLSAPPPPRWENDKPTDPVSFLPDSKF